MDGMYGFSSRMEELYGLLEDNLSRDIFWARVQFDISRSVDSAMRLFSLTGILSKAEIETQFGWRETFARLRREGKEIFLYGAGAVGRLTADTLLHDPDGAFTGFCDRNAAAFPDGLLGKPVYPPDYLFTHADRCYVMITSVDHTASILGFLRENRFPEDHILPYFNKFDFSFSTLIDRQYFDFPALYPADTVFVDGGCYDGATSAQFARWCGGRYSKILAFEPDPDNFRRCGEALRRQALERTELIPAGLSDRTGTVRFVANSDSSSCVVGAADSGTSLVEASLRKKEIREIQTVALDEVVKDDRVGFIKLDIEGEEYHALLGAREILKRDRPFLAISVYHRQGDVLAIMDYLHDLVPAYRFRLRHYNPGGHETILYASAPPDGAGRTA